MKFDVLPPISLYVHTPWCVKKCPYCDFNSHAVRGLIPEQNYVQALLKDLEQELCQLQNREIESVFFGGGTPSLFSAESIDSILSGIRLRTDLAGDAEITLEANPNSAEAAKFKAFREAGINRISIGIQSFDNTLLRNIGRLHDGDAAHAAAEAVSLAGFDNFNLDLMYALPGQSVDAALNDLKKALDYLPPHLSWYQLTIEPNTAFAVHPPETPDEETAWDMQTAAESTLAGCGYLHYEVSAHARIDRRCKHNLNYWQFGDYLGIGAGAHSKVTRPNRVERTWKIKHPTAYLSRAHTPARTGGRSTLSAEEVLFEFMLNALRLNQSVSHELFFRRTGQSIARLSPQLEIAQSRGLLRCEEKEFSATDSGRRFLNDLVEVFMPDRKTLTSRLQTA